MALIVETGAGVSGAESYLSVADAASLISKWTANTSFAAAATSAQERALRQAAAFLDAKFEGLLGGERILQGQSLAFPRYRATTRDGLLIPSDVVPDAWKIGQAMLAARAMSSSLAPDVSQDGALIEKETRIGPITTRKAWASSSGTAQQPNFPEVGNAVAVLLVGSGFVSRRELA